MSKDVRGELFAERLVKAADSCDPLSFAIVCYQSIRESPLFNRYKDAGDKEKMEELVKNSIVENARILKDYMKWEKGKIDKFIEYMIEFVQEI